MTKKIIYIVIFALIYLGCKKETIKQTVYVDGTNTIISGSDTTINNIEQYNSGHNSELISSMYVPPRLPSQDIYSAWAVVYSIKISNLKKGDIILASSQMEISNHYSNRPLVVSPIILGDSMLHIPSSTTNPIHITEHNGFDFIPPMQHAVVTSSGTYKCISDLGDRYVNCCIIFQQIGDTQVQNEYMFIEKGYGRLSVTVFRK